MYFYLACKIRGLVGATFGAHKGGEEGETNI